MHSHVISFLTAGFFLWASLINVFPLQAIQQTADPDFKPAVEKPAYTGNGPTIAIDQAHANFHTAGNRYKPFADLLAADGYTIVENDKPFAIDSLKAFSILIIANAGVPPTPDSVPPAFTEPECDAVRAWVQDGGSLLLIADHAPFGLAAENLGKKFGVDMGKGWVFYRNDQGNFSTQLIFSNENALLGDHPIVRGRDSSESAKIIRSFTGQSLSVPVGAVVLMRLSVDAREAADAQALNSAAESAEASKDKSLEETTKDFSTSVAGRAQGIVMEVGKGRVAVIGEAGMFSAQIARIADGDQTREIKMGMNVQGYDNQKFALNLMHWLSRLL